MVALAFVLLTIYILIYATVGVLGVKLMGKKMAKNSFSNTKLLLVISVIVSIGLALIWFYSQAHSILFSLAISLLLTVKSYLELRKKLNH